VIGCLGEIVDLYGVLGNDMNEHAFTLLVGKIAKISLFLLLELF
jgi:hypothetical protein